MCYTFALPPKSIGWHSCFTASGLYSKKGVYAEDEGELTEYQGSQGEGWRRA